MKFGAKPSKLLSPLVPAYRAALWLREKRLGTSAAPVRRLRFPVVSIGNLSTGGAGKTPLTIALAKSLAARGVQADVLSRGYGRQAEGAMRVADRGTAAEFGDEPLLIARETGVGVYVAGQRFDAGLLAEGDAITMAALDDTRVRVVHLLDDGFQHRQLARDVDILLLDRNDIADSLLPAGNLREPLTAMERATVLAIPADQPEVEQFVHEFVQSGRNPAAPRWSGPIWRLRRKMEIPALNGPVAAFCGIARPEQFYAGLEAGGAHLALRKSFADHHAYTAEDVQRLAGEARSAGAVALVTTKKDRVRLEALATAFPADLPLKTAGLRTEIEGEDEALKWLLGQLGVSAGQPAL